MTVYKTPMGEAAFGLPDGYWEGYVLDSATTSFSDRTSTPTVPGGYLVVMEFISAKASISHATTWMEFGVSSVGGEHTVFGYQASPAKDTPYTYEQPFYLWPGDYITIDVSGADTEDGKRLWYRGQKYEQ